MTRGPLPVSPTANSTLLWDGENRLTEVKNSTGTIIEKNVFDAGSRKIATTANGVTTLYLYDAWNCIAEYTRIVGVSPTLQKTRLWGSDLSGTPLGAGGVGGMLSESSQITSNPITFNSSYPTYDGNGNVSEYLDSTGQVTAHYEYDPFGNTVVNTDTSNQFAYRFSTKPLAFATGLYYYGYRYYDPMTGRWPSRDPIEEDGGINLYGFVENEAINGYDVHGLRRMPVRSPLTPRLYVPPPRGNTRRGVTFYTPDGRPGTTPYVPPRPPIVPPVYPPRETGDCSEYTHSLLQAIVDAACKTKRACACPPKDCAGWKDNHDKNIQCKVARDRINTQCYKGGDSGHKQAASQAQNAAISCTLLIQKHCP
jgi:RHS repeat-associated protein